MKKILSCIALLTIYAFMHSSDAQRPNNDANDIYIWYKKVFAKQFCTIALEQKRPDIAARIGSYVHSDTTWLSEIEKDSYPRPGFIVLEGLYKFQVMQDMGNQFSDLKEWFKIYAK